MKVLTAPETHERRVLEFLAFDVAARGQRVFSDSLNHQKMVDTRQAKIDYISNVIPELNVEGVVDAELLVIGWGTTHGHLMTAVNTLNKKGHKSKR